MSEDPFKDSAKLQEHLAEQMQSFNKLQQKLQAAFSHPASQLERFMELSQKYHGSFQADNSLKILADFNKRMAEQMRPFAEFRENVQSAIANTQAGFEQLRKFSDFIKRSSEGIALSFRQLSERLAESERQKQLILSVGLLPHASIPLELLDSAADVAVLRQSLKQFFEDNWTTIAEVIVARVATYDIDDEAKATLGEALQAHQQGHYRAVCRVLFPEIERVVRVELRDNKVGTIYVQSLMADTTDNIYLRDLELPTIFVIELFDRLADHLYQSIKNDDDRKRFEVDPVPNRHAAIHGLIVYSSFWNALNVIFMTDFTFQIISLAKRASSANVKTL
ncbi:hypothetical protein SAMN05216374_4624 [Tardiphaga sp. OK246]|jgi:hypothetical protein|uniref:hypothetical protein n=1 Tax=Tardiphaga sp. OK246 TaxID=1855307 RepID=UPI000B74FF0E|nr:hypothetical protein [Tardiphaga sp. OK246]SNT53127.1 hypothetical protein SAMN05216374_4624 [Tardiphaga sp. OK246]